MLSVENCTFSSDEDGWLGVANFGPTSFILVSDVYFVSTAGIGLPNFSSTRSIVMTIDNAQLDSGRYGVSVTGRHTFVSVTNSIFFGLEGTAIYTRGIGSVINVQESVMSNNTNGVSAHATGAVVRMSDNAVTSSFHGLDAVGGAAILSAGDNDIAINNGSDPTSGPLTLQ